MKKILLNKYFKLVILFCLVSLSAFSLVSCSRSNNKTEVYINSVHDGDTFKDSDGNTYRLFGVDTPEVSDQYNNFERTDGIEQIYAQNATEFARKLIEHKIVNIKGGGKDVYNRTVSKISIGDIDLGYELIRNGLARVAYFDVSNVKSPYYSSDYSYYENLVWAQKNAFDHHLGVWRNIDEFKEIFPKA